jgi:hypothetical protein
MRFAIARIIFAALAVVLLAASAKAEGRRKSLQRRAQELAEQAI